MAVLGLTVTGRDYSDGPMSRSGWVALAHTQRVLALAESGLCYAGETSGRGQWQLGGSGAALFLSQARRPLRVHRGPRPPTASTLSAALALVTVPTEQPEVTRTRGRQPRRHRGASSGVPLEDPNRDCRVLTRELLL